MLVDKNVYFSIACFCLQVFLTALLFSLIFKKADLSEGDEEDEEEIFLQPDEEWMHSMPTDPGESRHRAQGPHYEGVERGGER